MSKEKSNFTDLFDGETLSGEYLSIWKNDDLVQVTIGNITISLYEEEFIDLARLLYGITVIIDNKDKNEVEAFAKYIEERTKSLVEIRKEEKGEN